MSSIPPNMSITGSLAQSQVNASETRKAQDSQRNKAASDARQLNRLAEQQQDEVETTEETEHLTVHRRNEGGDDHSRQNAQPDQDPGLYTPKGPAPPGQKPTSQSDTPDQAPASHIDLSA